MQIVMVHGLWDGGHVYRRMRTVLEADGHRCLAPDLEPANACHGLADLGEKLRAYLDASLEPDGKLAWIGFSMGALLARHCLKHSAHAPRTTHLFSISGPLHGTLMARLWPGKAARDMRAGSEFLKDLHHNCSCLSGIIEHTYRTPVDLMVVPTSRSKVEGAENHVYLAPFHHAMLRHPGLIEHIRRTLKPSAGNKASRCASRH